MKISNKSIISIRRIREIKGYSQEYMSAMLNISQSAYSNLESGKSKCTLDRAMHISKILGVEMNELIENNSQLNLNETKNFSMTKESSSSKDELFSDLVNQLKEEISFLRSLLENKK